jgi:glycosyltransferase involved in cell wall biosynthesis
MKKVGVLHPDLSALGGAEAVCMNILEALQEDYETTLVTLSEPDFSDLNAYFDTGVSDINTYVPGISGIKLKHLTDALQRLSRVGQMIRLEVAILNWISQRVEDQFDLILAARGEYPPTSSVSMQYIHFPIFCKQALERDFSIKGQTSEKFAWRVLNQIIHHLGGVYEDVYTNSNSSAFITNSNWTGNIVSKLYGVNTKTIYPPVNVESFSSDRDRERECGFVTIGRIDEDKRINRCLNIIRGLRNRGFDVHLHIVGPTYDDKYEADLMREIRDEDFLIFEGEVRFDRLVEIVRSHRYGLHSKEFEHFGISVAELIAGGAIPFVHNSGGVREIVGHDHRLLYTDTEEAIEKADRVLSDGELQAAIRSELPDPDIKFGRQRFRKEIRESVEN